ncbi:S ribonuclease [Pyrus ussuriensis x Pyrus communis]|uniref:S ribonuclease n=1 Tax=Pyrus ussuriensis x Pyrus communis TaxID=2448454 RepID=A0A5N5G4X5_9ROSA|nr:S ribonuclease [Pyrus ussuriensis x Pyrus communis]
MNLPPIKVPLWSNATFEVTSTLAGKQKYGFDSTGVTTLTTQNVMSMVDNNKVQPNGGVRVENWKGKRSMIVENTNKYTVNSYAYLKSLSYGCLWWISTYRGEFRIAKDEFNDPSMVYSAKDVVRDIKTTLRVTVSYKSASRARGLALASRCGSPEDSYANLPTYCAEFERLNLGNKTTILTNGYHHFLYFFFAIGVSVRGFLSGMQPYKGVLLVATVFECNRNIYPLAFGIGDTKSDDCWEWFFKQLHGVIGDVSNLVIISDHNASVDANFCHLFL